MPVVDDALSPYPNYPATGVIQFEPFYYFFNMKNGNANGTATDNHNRIARPLGISLPYQ